MAGLDRRLRFLVGAAVGAACGLGVVFSPAAELAPEGWTQHLRHRT
jgi:hypothetical protein